MTDGHRKRIVSWVDVRGAVADMAFALRRTVSADPLVWGVPRGGSYIAAMLAGMGVRVAPYASLADAIVDDVEDSGDTRASYEQLGKPFFAAFKADGEWLVFPWETAEPEGGEANVARLLQVIGEDPKREGLADTPGRYVRALKELTRGYSEDPAKILGTTFAEDTDEMIVVKGIPFWSLCEHHMLPFHGVAHVGYIPGGHAGTGAKNLRRIVGLSKIPRLVECFARRLQVQERMTSQIATALHTTLGALGTGVVVEGTHLCMAMRGVQKAATMTTSSVLGRMRDDGAVRGEFLRLIGK